MIRWFDAGADEETLSVTWEITTSLPLSVSTACTTPVTVMLPIATPCTRPMVLTEAMFESLKENRMLDWGCGPPSDVIWKISGKNWSVILINTEAEIHKYRKNRLVLVLQIRRIITHIYYALTHIHHHAYIHHAYIYRVTLYNPFNLNPGHFPCDCLYFP